MNGPVDVLTVIDDSVCVLNTVIGEKANGSNQLAIALIAVAELIGASREYYTGYCQDEADDDAVEFCCSADQSRAAKRLRDALALCGVTP